MLEDRPLAAFENPWWRRPRLWIAGFVGLVGVLTLARLFFSSAPEARITDSFGHEMALVPAGAFQMGSDRGRGDELPVHPVFLDAFYMDAYEVTNRQFAAFLEAKGNQVEGNSTWLHPADQDSRIQLSRDVWSPDAGFEDHPVVEVSWYGARAYCEWRGARLPTEAEWEKAARGGLEGMEYPWGNEKPVCTAGKANGAQFSVCDGQTAPVGSFAPNGFGLYDIAGNVWEWVSDLYAADGYQSAAPNNPRGPEDGSSRVLRGGSWIGSERFLRTAARIDDNPDYSNFNVGFRCARSE